MTNQTTLFNVDTCAIAFNWAISEYAQILTWSAQQRGVGQAGREERLTEI